MLSIPEALSLLGAGLLSSEFEKLKVQIIDGSLVGGHPPTPFKGGLVEKMANFIWIKTLIFQNLTALPLGGGREGLAKRNDRSSEASAAMGKRCRECSTHLPGTGRFFTQNLPSAKKKDEPKFIQFLKISPDLPKLLLLPEN
jgi:hypothetical protein